MKDKDISKNENNANPSSVVIESFYSGYDDIHNVKINHGDIVRFYFDEYKGYSQVKKYGYTEMIDVCYFDKNSEAFYLVSQIGAGAYVYRHNNHCEVIGNVATHIDLLKDFKMEAIQIMFPELSPY